MTYLDAMEVIFPAWLATGLLWVFFMARCLYSISKEKQK